MVGTRSLSSGARWCDPLALPTLLASSLRRPRAGAECGGSGAILGRSRVIGTIARHPIEAFNPADDRLVVRYGPVRSAVGRRDGGRHDPDPRRCACRSDQYLYKRIGFSCVARGRIRRLALDSSRFSQSTITTGVPPRFSDEVFDLRQPTLQLIYDAAPIGLAFLSPDCRYLPGQPAPDRYLRHIS